MGVKDCRNKSSVDLQSIFPLKVVMDDLIVSKRGDVTAGWEVILPQSFSVTEEGYENIISGLKSAIVQMPDWTMIHRQDIFKVQSYVKEEKDGFLAQSFERHFNERKYLNHRQFIYLTFTNRDTYLRPVSSCGLFGFSSESINEMSNRASDLTNKAPEFESMIKSKTGFGMRRIRDEELYELLDHCMNLHSDDNIYSNIPLFADGCQFSEKRMWAYSFCESDQLPGEIASSRRDSKVNTSVSKLHQSTASSLGFKIDCDHLVNQYIFKVSEQSIISELSGRRRRMQSMSREADNDMHGQQIEEYISGSAIGDNVTVKTHLNVLVWGKEEDYLKVKSQVSSAVSDMGLICVQDCFTAPLLFYCAIPGASCEIGAQNLITTELSAALCLGINETSEVGIENGTLKLCDRVRHIPITIDLHKAAADAGYIGNYNTFILGGSGTGKSFFTNHLARSCYDSGESVFIIDVGDSYEGLCSVINDESGGIDGFYNTWDEKNPLSFDAFIGWEEWLDEHGHLRRESSGVSFIVSFIKMLWSPMRGWTSSNVAVLNTIIEDFARQFKSSGRYPIFDDFYKFVAGPVRHKMKSKDGYRCNKGSVTAREFEIEDMIVTIGQYTSGGTYGFLLNRPMSQRMTQDRFIVFEVDKLSSMDKTFYSLCIMCMLNLFDHIMRNRPGSKTLIIEEAWMAIANKNSASYLNGLWKTARKFSTSATVVTQQITDLLHSDVIRDTILQNSDVKILLEQSANMGSLPALASMLGFDEHQTDTIRSMSKGSQDGYIYKEVFVSLGGVRYGVYATEVSPEEAIAYESNKQKKELFMRYSRDYGPIEAIRILK